MEVRTNRSGVWRFADTPYCYRRWRSSGVWRFADTRYRYRRWRRFL